MKLKDPSGLAPCSRCGHHISDHGIPTCGVHGCLCKVFVVPRGAAAALAAPRIQVRLEFKLRDFWIGAYWEVKKYTTHLWICLVPCLSIHVTWRRKQR